MLIHDAKGRARPVRNHHDPLTNLLNVFTLNNLVNSRTNRLGLLNEVYASSLIPEKRPITMTNIVTTFASATFYWFQLAIVYCVWYFFSCISMALLRHLLEISNVARVTISIFFFRGGSRFECSKCMRTNQLRLRSQCCNVYDSSLKRDKKVSGTGPWTWRWALSSGVCWVCENGNKLRLRLKVVSE